MVSIGIRNKEDAALQAALFDLYCKTALKRPWIPELIELPVNRQTAVRLAQDDPAILSAYLFQQIRVRTLLEKKVARVRQFTLQNAEVRLAVWDAWVRCGGSYVQAAGLLRERHGVVMSRQGVYHHIRALQQDRIIRSVSR